MSFNLKAKRSQRMLDKMRSLSDDCANLRPSDLDGMSEEDMYHFYHGIERHAGAVKTAIHGMGETWNPVGQDYSPYKTSPLVNNQGPEFGGRWRRDMPGAGDQHINDDGDKDKSGRGDSDRDDFDPNLQKHRLEALTDQIKGPTFVVRIRLSEEEEPSDKKAIEIFGDDGRTDGKSVYVLTNGFESALEIQRRHPGATVEPKGA